MKLLILSLTLISFSLFAEEMKEDGSSGCGYGWEVTKEKTLFASSIRSTTNMVASNSIAMTMGTSGCEKHKLVKHEKMKEHYVNVNYENLIADMASGHGEFILTFAHMMGCDNTNLFQSKSKENFADLIGSGPQEMLKNYNKAVKYQLKTACI